MTESSQNARIPFTKMHGLGNDYVYVNGFEHSIADPSKLAVQISDRHFGVGGDGLILILPSTIADARMQMFNADGSEGKMCGNGVRCVGKFLFERGLVEKPVINLETASGIKVLYLDVSDGAVRSVTVDMGAPILDAAHIPVLADSSPVLELSFKEFSQANATCVSMGNPHAIFFVPEIADRQILEVGPVIERHEKFPARTNVEFIKVISESEIEMRVWERGSGETLACGTGACAAVVAGIMTQRLNRERPVTVHLRGGDLVIEWRKDDRVYKTGPATFVFDGIYLRRR